VARATGDAVSRGDLLDYVGAAGRAVTHVRSGAWRHDRKALPGHAHVESKSRENRGHLVDANGDAEDAFDVALVECLIVVG